MNFVSTRNKRIARTLSTAIQEGLAMDGGLFVPESIPEMDAALFSDELSYSTFSSRLLANFFKADPLELKLDKLCEQAFNFPLPVKQLDRNLFILELFHGPTSSFKDIGARFLAECLNETAHDQKNILVATSGDTGSAVASAFYRKSNCRAIILYPDGRVSEKQEQQMTCWDENIFALAVDGSFDQCQQLVKSAFFDPNWQSTGGLSSANSINIGRLLPQMIYYAYSSMEFYKQHAIMPGYIIPSGNLGNATAAHWAKAMGFPIRDIILTTNANRALSNYLSSGHYQPQLSVATIANAMDVGDPSNLERLKHLFGSFDNFKQQVKAMSVNDESIRQTIIQIYKQYQYISCPHTATAFYAHKQLDKKPWIVVATADPCKFNGLIEPLIKTRVPIAPQLEQLVNRPNKIRRVNANLDAIKEFLSTNE